MPTAFGFNGAVFGWSDDDADAVVLVGGGPAGLFYAVWYADGSVGF